jgi:transcriptional regulator with XRE-family HTH domain
MGTGKRVMPEHLGEKLKFIREQLRMTTREMAIALEHPAIKPHSASITQYEKGRREPPLAILLKYARLYKINVELLIDDDLTLP